MSKKEEDGDNNEEIVENSEPETGADNKDMSEHISKFNSPSGSTSGESKDYKQRGNREQLFENHFEEIVEQAEEKTEGYNKKDTIEQYKEESEQTQGIDKYKLQAQALYNKSILSFAKNDGFGTIKGFNIGWMMPQFLAIIFIITRLLAKFVDGYGLILIIYGSLALIPLSTYFIFDVYDYYANEEITSTAAQISYSLLTLTVIGVAVFHYYSDKHREEAIQKFLTKNDKVIDNLTQKYTQ